MNIFRPITHQLSSRLAISLSIALLVFGGTAQASSDTTTDKVKPDSAQTPKQTTAEVLAASAPSDWRLPKQEDLVYLKMGDATVVFELANDFTPAHIANLRTLAKEAYFDGTFIIRSQDNYVVQWGDPAEDMTGSETKPKSLGSAKTTLEHELYRQKAGLEIEPIDSRDAYADEVGFVNGFAVAAESDSTSDNPRAWLTHCYASLGVGRDLALDSGNASSLYAVIGHSPRHLDLNVTVMGRAIAGMQHLSTLPRGTGPLGFYESPEERTTIDSVRFGDQLPKAEQLNIEILRTDTDTFRAYVSSRTHRADDWNADSVDHIEICNVNVPSRALLAVPAKQ